MATLMLFLTVLAVVVAAFYAIGWAYVLVQYARGRTLRVKPKAILVPLLALLWLTCWAVSR